MSKFDWSKSNIELAKEHGVSRETMRSQRTKAGAPTFQRGGKRTGAGGKYRTVAKINGVDGDEKKRWHDAHKKAGMRFDTWARAALNDAAERDLL